MAHLEDKLAEFFYENFRRRKWSKRGGMFRMYNMPAPV